jgi:hypothetical protein
MYRAGFIATGIALLSGVATAQVASGKPAQEHVRGDVVTVSGNTLTVKSRSGETMTLHLPDDARVSLLEKGGLGDIHDGTFIGTTAVPESNGTLRAVEVHIFPESMRGTGEGHRPWDLHPGSTMTNATVSAKKGAKAGSTMTNATVAKVAGQKLTLKYSGGEKTVDVPSNATIVKIEPSDRSKIVPGAHLFAVASRQPDGTLRADRIYIGKDGLTPPM